MNIIEIIILGIVQGIGEFLPISSSAHLILIPYIFDFSLNMDSSEKLAFDVSLHFGTLLAVIFVFYKDWLNIFNGVFNRVVKKQKSFENNMFWYLVLATIPGALAGFLFEDEIEVIFRDSPLLIALALAVMGVLLYIVDMYALKKYNNEITYEKLSLKDTFIIGISQAFAIIPGFSRSGTTMLMGRLIGLSREASAKFTFMLSVPIIFGAFILQLDDLIINFDVMLGVLISFVVGVFTIKFLLQYIKEKGFKIFAYYRLLIAFIVLVKVLIG